jgi:glucans biosynthesis protein
VRFDPAQALWAGAGLPFQLQPHHRGFLFNQRVELFEVADGRAVPILFQAGQFRYEGMAAPRPEEDLGFAGFRLLYPLNRPDHFDELCSFLGASYFRALGRGNVYGISARGLALGTAEPSGEEFPGFSAFWIERPEPGAEAITLHALMESISLTGAFRMRITPGDTSIMQIEARLFPRRDITRIGVAPMTSMFFFGPNDREGVSDYRLAWRAGQSLGTQRHDPHACLRRRLRSARSARPQAVRRRDHEP